MASRPSVLLCVFPRSGWLQLAEFDLVCKLDVPFYIVGTEGEGGVGSVPGDGQCAEAVVAVGSADSAGVCEFDTVDCAVGESARGEIVEGITDTAVHDRKLGKVAIAGKKEDARGVCFANQFKESVAF